jgi:hypothetical protein
VSPIIIIIIVLVSVVVSFVIGRLEGRRTRHDTPFILSIFGYSPKSIIHSSRAASLMNLHLIPNAHY